MADGGAFVKNCTIGGFELLNDRSGTVARCFDDPDTLIDDDFRVAVIVWGYEGGQEGEIDAEWVLGHCSTSSDFLAEVFRGRLCESGELLQWVSLAFESGLKSVAYNTESSGVADSTCEFSVAHPEIHISCQRTLRTEASTYHCIPPWTTGTTQRLMGALYSRLKTSYTSDTELSRYGGIEGHDVVDFYGVCNQAG